MKGIILAGGSGSRLYPLTLPITKQLLPVYDKPLIYYPLSILMLSGIKEYLIITTPIDRPHFESLLGDGSQLGISIQYKTQEEPKGIAEAFIIGEEFIGDDSVTFILGDNIFFGHLLPETVIKAQKENKGATLFGYGVKDPERFGIAECNDQGKVLSLEEKPTTPKSNLAVTGLYIYDNRVVEFAKKITPSDRGELEITALNQCYLDENDVQLKIIGRGNAWLDTGTHESLMEASKFIEIIQNRQGFKIACLEEIAYRQKFITKDQLVKLAEPMLKNQYGDYLMRISNE